MKLEYAIIFLSNAFSSVAAEKLCHTEQDRFQFIPGTSVTHCVNECGARQHCQALNFWSKVNLCELFSTPTEIDQRRGNCVYIKKEDMNATKTTCQTDCEYGKVCEKGISGGRTCNIKECITIPVVENGIVLGNRRDVGAVIRYKCDYGYEIYGSTVAKCLDTGNWSISTKCVKVNRSCESKVSTGSIKIESIGTDVGDTLHSTCQFGHKRISGSTERMCTKYGTWSKAELICEAIEFFEPDFESPWYELDSRVATTTLVSIAHGLGETPLLVDVQVKVTSGENAGYIFPAAGCTARDDDRPEAYGGITYIYNNQYIKVSSPTLNNGNLGRCVYTGTSPYWEGPYSTDSYTAMVRVRAWKNTSLPAPSYSETNIPITGGQSSGSYVKRSHGIGDYPTLVISRTKFPSTIERHPGYYSDSVGAAFSMFDGYTHSSRSYVVYGYNNSTIRVWASSVANQGIFNGKDGWNFNMVKSGELELYAWDKTQLSPTETGSLTLGQSVPGSNLEQGFSSIGGIDKTFTRAWVQASSDPNFGFRFIGSGSLAYFIAKKNSYCTYGGLLYAYGEGSIRYWQPGAGNGISNGALICIPDSVGDGVSSQASSGGQAVYSSWKLIGRN